MEKPQITYRRHVEPGDLEAVKEMAESTGFFYDFEIPVALELVEDGLKEGEHCGYKFLFAEINGKPVSYTCYGHIMGTEAGYDLYWIITHNDYRGQGIGKIILEETHRIIKELGGKYVIAETSGLEKYTPTRRFYVNFGYKLEAQIPDFYKEGDAKAIFIYRF
ncbi:MAG: GNAT family N-acetyltransferase [Bacteroidetes bacterium]|nr:GNAT family N-acetyltransferase [Bacteroidota bacterium]